MLKLHRLFTLALLAASGTAIATTLPLDTGYNHGGPAYYGPNDTRDHYWIKIASYEPPAGSVPVDDTYIYHGQALTAGGSAKALGPNPTGYSSLGTHTSNKAYAIYRKCFCLLSTENVSLNFTVRADEWATVWLNGVATILAGPAEGWDPNISAASSRPTDRTMFREGRNCIYVLVEDSGIGTSFSLSGWVSGPGLMPMMAEGKDASFGPCRCPEPQPGTMAAPRPGVVSDMIRGAERARQASAPEAAPPSEAPSAPR